MYSQKRLMSLFESLGPIMIGPSSSHTAGIARIGRMGRQFLVGSPDSIELHFYGALSQTYKGHFSDSAVVGGLIGLHEDSPELSESLKIATKMGITVSYILEPDSQRNPNTVDMRLVKGNESVKIVGISTGGGEILISEFNDFSIKLHGNEDALLLITRRTVSEDEIAAHVGDSLQNFSTAELRERKLSICFLKQSPSGNLAEKVKNAIAAEAVYAISSIYDYKLTNSEPLFSSFAEMLNLCERQKVSIADMAIAYEKCRSGLDYEGILNRIQNIWDVMVKSIEHGIHGHNDLVAGFMPGNDAAKLMKLVDERKNISGSILGAAVARALATMETNGCMGCVAAAPTAGSCGVMPGSLVTLAEAQNANQEKIFEALLAGAMVGVLIAMRAPVSGAIGGCQSEIGVASAMTAAGLVQLVGGSPKQVAHAAALALKNMLGLICDPVAGPVEIPCIKRNAIGVANAFAAADMALAGIESIIPPDEVIDALINVQNLLPVELKGTLKGGLACTSTAQRLNEVWKKKLADKGKRCSQN